jgi:hypothetical protein
LELTEHPLVRKLLSLGLPPEDYVVAGSGPLFAHGLRDLTSDLDVVARGAAWDVARSHGEPVPAPGGGHVIPLFDGAVEIFDQWLSGAPEPDTMIATAERVSGVPFSPLEQVIAWKERQGRPKDRSDIDMIRKYLAATGRDGGKPPQPGTTRRLHGAR